MELVPLSLVALILATVSVSCHRDQAQQPHTLQERDFKQIIELQAKGYSDVIQPDQGDCEILGGQCVEQSKVCPDNLPSDNYTLGTSFCSKGHRCCLPGIQESKDFNGDSITDKRSYTDYYSMAKMYAPFLRFDSKQHEKNKCFPSSASAYVEERESGNNGRICNSDFNTIVNGLVPTYWKAQECGPHVYIDYWVFYGYQDCCGKVFWTCQGSHELDWEHIIVKVYQKDHLDAVQYYQHSGWYTKYPGNYETLGTHPIVYVGKNSHGSYHDQGGTNAFGIAGCAYYGDYRKPGTTNWYMATWWNLQNYMDESDPRFVEVMNSKYFADNTTPKQRNIDLCSRPGCRGRDVTEFGKIRGCFKSDADEKAGF